jgi:imidazoleglycerol-phosphate dehydratase/histidinol-phosphatase
MVCICPTIEKLLFTFKNEGIVFDQIFIDKTFPKENAATRKPGTALLLDYIDNPNYDLSNSFMIGDRLTDVELAKNLGAKGIYINDETHLGVNEISVKKEKLEAFIALETNDWRKIYKYLKNLE